jgi:hypothetical protein
MPPVSLTASIEVDVQPRNNTKLTDFVEGSLGELSMFHRTHGFYIHCMPIENATLPPGWEGRVTPVVDRMGGQESVGWCLEPHDLAVSKLAANREKDRDYVRTLLVERMIEPLLLQNRLNESAIANEHRARIKAWVEATTQDI